MDVNTETTYFELYTHDPEKPDIEIVIIPCSAKVITNMDKDYAD